MLVIAIIFGILAVLLGLFGLRTASRAASSIAWLFAFVFLVVFVVTLVTNRA